MATRIGKKNLSTEDKAQILDLLLQGKSSHKIGRLLNLHPYTVLRIKHDYLEVKTTLTWHPKTGHMQSLVEARRKVRSEVKSPPVPTYLPKD